MDLDQSRSNDESDAIMNIQADEDNELDPMAADSDTAGESEESMEDEEPFSDDSSDETNDDVQQVQSNDEERDDEENEEASGSITDRDFFEPPDSGPGRLFLNRVREIMRQRFLRQLQQGYDHYPDSDADLEVNEDPPINNEEAEVPHQDQPNEIEIPRRRNNMLTFRDVPQLHELRMVYENFPIPFNPPEPENEPQVDSPVNFDTNLPAEHLYLGKNMNRVSGVEYLDVGRIHRLMLFLHQYVVYPGEILPFMVPNFIIDTTIDSANGLLFGVAFPRLRHKKNDNMIYGVTCQIYEKGNDERGHTLVKSRALQRFITSRDTAIEPLEFITANPQLKSYGYVKILPEIYLPEPLRAIDMGSMNRFRGIAAFERHFTNYQTATVSWPAHIYKNYSISTIIEKARRCLASHKIDTMPTDPTTLSFWLARNLHFSEEQLKNIFTTDSVNIRLKIISDAFKDGGIFTCRFCNHKIAKCSDLFAMSKHGVQSQYCNSAGYIHETNTVYRLFSEAVNFSGEPSSEFSWFPGYSWHIIVCKMCTRHIGWRFRAIEPNLTPATFYGLSGASVRISEKSAAPIHQNFSYGFFRNIAQRLNEQ